MTVHQRVRTSADWPESEYRAEIKKVTDYIVRQVDALDPDQIEAGESNGVVTLTFGDKNKIILSAQPSKRQLWIVLTASNTAVHYNWGAITGPDDRPSNLGMWLDEKNEKPDVVTLLAAAISEKIGQKLDWKHP